VALTRVVGKPADDGHDTPHVCWVISHCRQRFQYQAADHLPAAKRQSLRLSHVCRLYRYTLPYRRRPSRTIHLVPHILDIRKIRTAWFYFTDRQARPDPGRPNFVRWRLTFLVPQLWSVVHSFFGGRREPVHPCWSVTKPSPDVCTICKQTARGFQSIRIHVCVADNWPSTWRIALVFQELAGPRTMFRICFFFFGSWPLFLARFIFLRPQKLLLMKLSCFISTLLI
jgi:hypothetical protein